MHYEQRKVVASITPLVKNASLRVANAVRFDTDKTSITYKELFEKLDSDISEIDKRILDIQTIATPGNKKTTDPALTYLRASQVLLRALRWKDHKKVAVTAQEYIVERLMDDLGDARYYGARPAWRATDRALKDFDKSFKEYVASASDVLDATMKMKEAHKKATSCLSSDALTDPAIFDVLAAKYYSDPSDSSRKK